MDADLDPSDEELQWFQQSFAQLHRNVEEVVVGKPEAVRLALICLIAEGHLLIEDVPGTGKTSLAKSIASSIEGKWNRIQFTPDLLPADITGATIFNQAQSQFEFHPGPIFANVVLGDEINRASPKTQSALLQVMDEHHVSVDGSSYAVPRPFMVLATQNPIEFEGTYRLPEAQLDRFLMRISLGYLEPSLEVEVLARHGRNDAQIIPEPIATSDAVSAMIRIAEQVHVEPVVQQYIVSLAHYTRELPEVRLGASTRACLGLQRAARVAAASSGRNYVRPDDVKELASSVLAHRLVLNREAMQRQTSSHDLVQRCLRDVAPPVSRRSA